jgi:hypothetical protein
LIRDGIASGQWRGHHMGPARFTSASTAESFCTICGRGVWANTHPAPNGIDIAGEAVALGCNRLMEGSGYFRSRKHNIACKDRAHDARGMEYRMSGLSVQYIMRAALCREPFCASEPNWKRTAESEIENLTWYSDYAEPGYSMSHGDRGILAADWNYFPRDIRKILERAGYEIEWNDEWNACEDCGKAVRTSPDCYSYQPYYAILNDCKLYCLDCLNREEYLESIEDNSSAACFRAINPAEHGYTLLSDPGQYENGFHPGQNDNPVKILAELQARGKEHIVFRIPETSQFYITFEVWQRKR